MLWLHPQTSDSCLVSFSWEQRNTSVSQSASFLISLWMDWCGSMRRGRGACWDCSGIWEWIVREREDERGGFTLRKRERDKQTERESDGCWRKYMGVQWLISNRCVCVCLYSKQHCKNVNDVWICMCVCREQDTQVFLFCMKDHTHTQSNTVQTVGVCVCVSFSDYFTIIRLTNWWICLSFKQPYSYPQ